MEMVVEPPILSSKYGDAGEVAAEYSFQTSVDVAPTSSRPPALLTRSKPPSSFGETLADTLWVYVGPGIFVVGIFGNVLILLVMAQRRMRGSSTCVYLRWMAAADLAVLVSGMVPEWLSALDIVNLKEYHPALCKLEKMIFYTSSDTSIWICVVFTLDRFVAVCFPFQRRGGGGAACCLRPSKSKYCAAASLLAAVVKNLHVLWTRGPQYVTKNNETRLHSLCGRPTPEYGNFETYVRPWIAFALVSALPFLIIVFCNIFIVLAMIRMRRARHLVAIMVSVAADNSVFQMTALCLSASFCFLICVTPSMILLIGKPYWNNPPNDSYAIVKSIINQIFYVNHSINFFLYCITGDRFRRALRSLGRASSDDAQSSTMMRRSNYRRARVLSAPPTVIVTAADLAHRLRSVTLPASMTDLRPSAQSSPPSSAASRPAGVVGQSASLNGLLAAVVLGDDRPRRSTDRLFDPNNKRQVQLALGRTATETPGSIEPSLKMYRQTRQRQSSV